MGRDDLVASAAYQPEPTAAAAARRFVRDILQQWVVSGPTAGQHRLVDDAVLLTSELVTNAVVHAGTPVQVTCKLAGGEVEVVVSDAYPARLVPEPAGGERSAAERTSGRGLLLPAALASAWGVSYGRTAKAVWFRLGLTGQQSQGSGLREGQPKARTAGPVARAAVTPALHLPGLPAATATAGLTARGGNEESYQPPAMSGVTAGGPAASGYRALLAATAESARTAVRADGAALLLAGEDGGLRLQVVAGSAAALAAGTVPPSVLTVPFVVDGHLVGLLSAVSSRPGAFGDTQAQALQGLADAYGPRLRQSWLDELERVRRGRIAALGQARRLLLGGLGQEEIMVVVGRAAVPSLAPWCAVLLPDEAGGLRVAYVRHAEDSPASGLTRLLRHACETAPPTPAAGPRPGATPGHRWRLPVSAGDEPPEATAFSAAHAWCFPIGEPWDRRGTLIIGADWEGWISREVAVLASDLACRIGFALAGGGLLGTRQS